MKLADYAYTEQRYKLLQKTNPEEAARLMKLAQEAADLRWATYEHMANQDPSEFVPVG
jgi:pyruvate-ferredoxin/flavodoxin oxidoreductase